MTLEECISNGKVIASVVPHEGVFVTIFSTAPDASEDSFTLSGTDFNYTQQNFCNPDEAFLNSLQQYKQSLEQTKGILIDKFHADNASLSELERVYQFLPVSWKTPLQRIIAYAHDLYYALIGKKSFGEVMRNDAELSLIQISGYNLCQDFFKRGYEIMEREKTALCFPVKTPETRTATSEIVRDIALLYEDLVLRTNKWIELQKEEHLSYYGKPLELSTVGKVLQKLTVDVLPNKKES